MMENELSYKIIGAAIEVHRTLGGPGLLESIYEEALCYELSMQGICVHRQVPVEVFYKDKKIKHSLFLDILADNKVIIEVKATEKHTNIFESQILTYLRLTGKRLGLLINFNNHYLKNGIIRVVNDL